MRMRELNRISIAVCLLVFMLFGNSHQGSAADDYVIGMISMMEGDWTVSDKAGQWKKPTRFAIVVEGSTFKSASKKALLQIRLIDRTVVTLHESKLASRPIVLTHAPDNLWQRAFKLLSERPQDYIPTIGRGSWTLHDAIVKSDASAVDLSQVFAESPPQHIARFTMRPLPSTGSEPARVIGRFQLAVSSNHVARMELPEVPPGLYELATVEGKDDRPLDKCWLLILKPDQYAAAKAKWQAAVSKTRNWQEVENACSRQCFLRAILASLSATSGSRN